MTLSAPFAALARFPQFINWHLVPRDPKPAKVPFDPTTGKNIDPHDPKNWKTYERAKALADRNGCGVGFVLTAEDPFFFIDLDNCIDDEGTFSPVAQDILRRFDGAAVEISQSGRGIHIMGCGKVPKGRG